MPQAKKIPKVEINTEQVHNSFTSKELSDYLEELEKTSFTASNSNTVSSPDIKVKHSYFDTEPEENIYDEDEDRENPESFTDIRNSYSKKPEIPKRNLDLLIDYSKTKSITSLTKYLFKEGFITNSSSSMVYNPRNIDIEVLRVTSKRNITFGAKSIAMDLNFDLSIAITSKETIPVQESLIEDLVYILEQIYMTPKERKLIFRCTTNEVLLDVLKEAILRDVKVDPLLNSSKFDFKSLRREGFCIKVAYVHFINELFLVNDHEFSNLENGLPMIYKIFNEWPIEPKIKSVSEVEYVEIGGKKFIKKVFESMIESNYESFINNLELENYLYEQDNRSGNAGDGDSSSVESLKFI